MLKANHETPYTSQNWGQSKGSGGQIGSTEKVSTATKMKKEAENLSHVTHVPHSCSPRHCNSESNPSILRGMHPSNQLDPYATITFPLSTLSAMKRKNSSALMFRMDVKANKQQIKLAMKKLFNTAVAKTIPSSGPLERRGYWNCSRGCSSGCDQQDWGIILTEHSWWVLNKPSIKGRRRRRKKRRKRKKRRRNLLV